LSGNLPTGYHQRSRAIPAGLVAGRPMNLHLLQPPPWLLDRFPEGVRTVLQNGGWWGVLGLVALIALLLIWGLLRRLGRLLLWRKPPPPRQPELDENLDALPPPPEPTGTRILTVEGIPVRLRLVVLARAGREPEVTPETADRLLDRVVPGLSALAADDQPALRIWPPQLSYEGFGVTFHRHIEVTLPEGEPTNWVLVAGRVKVGVPSLLVGMALWADEPTTIGRLTLEPHQWALLFRIRQRLS
jgi:hypothetical protein